MTDRNKIKPRRSYTSGYVPMSSDLEANELAINWADGKAFTKDAAGQIVSVTMGGSGGSGSLVTAASVSAFPATGSASNLYITTEDQRLWRWDSTAGIYVESGPIGGGFSFASVPASATSSGSVGQVASDGSYWYYCSAPNTWVRTALSTWTLAKSPDQITGLVGWWDFSDTTTLYDSTSGGSTVSMDGGSVARVEDKSGNGKHLVAGNAPTYKTSIVNSRGILRFNGSSSYLINSSFAHANTSLCAFLVCRTTATNGSGQIPLVVFPATNSAAPNDNYLYISLQDNSASPVNDRFGYGGTNAEITSAVSRPSVSIYGISASSGTCALSVNGISIATGPAVDLARSSSGAVSDIPTRSVLAVGGFVRPANPSGILFYPGDMCEIVWYSADISAGDKAALVLWLKNKWGIT